MTTTQEPPALVQIDIPTMLAWGDPKRVQTGKGPRLLRKAPVTDGFWQLWRSGKFQLTAAGVSVSKDRQTNTWEACWWSPVSQEETIQQQQAIEASKATDSTADLPRPAGMEYLGYQKAGIVFMAERFQAGQRGVLMADEQGLGKTIQAIGTISANPDIKNVLIICPNTLKLNWARELEKWLTRPLTIGVAHSKHFPATDVVIINYDVLSKFDFEKGREWDLVICDEAHYLKNPKSIRAKCVFGHKPSKKAIQEGATSRAGIPTKRRLPMTGTPILNRPMEAFPLLNWIDPDRWDNGFKFGLRYAAGKQTKWGWDFSGASNLEELQRELRSRYMIRRLKKDVLKELPPKRRQVIELESEEFEDLVADERQSSKAVHERLDQLQARVELAKVGDDPDAYKAAIEALRDGQGALFTEMAKARYRTGMAKIPQVIEFVTDQLEHGKVLLFCHHVDALKAYAAAFPQSVMVYGDVKLEDRQAAVDRFQTDPDCNVFIGNDAAAEGLTLTAANHVIFAEGDWVPGKLAQKEDRAHRIGQHDSVLVTYLVMSGSLDATMIKRCVRKLDVIDQALDRTLKARPAPEQQILTVTIERLEAQEPARRHDSVGVTIQELESEAPKLTAEQVAAVHEALQRLAQVCDYAQEEDGQGFNGCDANIGHSLANQSRLSPRQAVLGQKIIRKYRGQVGQELCERAGCVYKAKGKEQ